MGNRYSEFEGIITEPKEIYLKTVKKNIYNGVVYVHFQTTKKINFEKIKLLIKSPNYFISEIIELHKNLEYNRIYDEKKKKQINVMEKIILNDNYNLCIRLDDNLYIKEIVIKYKNINNFIL